MENLFHPSVIPGWHGSISRAALEADRAAQQRAMQAILRKVRLSETPNMTPPSERPETSART